jgi:hypothetical protein
MTIPHDESVGICAAGGGGGAATTKHCVAGSVATDGALNPSPKYSARQQYLPGTLSVTASDVVGKGKNPGKNAIPLSSPIFVPPDAHPFVVSSEG